MARTKMAQKQELVNDLDLEIKVRSSRVKLPELLTLVNLIVEAVRVSRDIQLVEQNTSANKTADRLLYTVTTKFQSPD